MTTATFHAGTVETSPRLSAVLVYLEECGSEGATTLAILQHCPTTRPSSDVSELRANGYTVDCQYVGKSSAGAKVHRYTLQ